MTRRVFYKVVDLLGHQRLHSIQQVGVRNDPIPIGVRVFVGSLERVAAQVEHFRRPEFHERLEPAQQLFGSLFHEHHFPVAHANSKKVAVVAEIEKVFPGALLRLSGQIRQEIMAVDVHLVGLAPNLMAARAAFRKYRVGRQRPEGSGASPGVKQYR